MIKSVAVVDAGIGNVASVVNMFRKIGIQASLVSDPARLCDSARIVLPGVGSFDGGMSALHDSGFDEAIRTAAHSGARILGICLGMQLLFERSEEGAIGGLGLVPGDVRKLRVSYPGLKIPHMGWNAIHPTRKSFLFSPDDAPQRFYFVHSYHVVCADDQDVTATTRHGIDFACAVERGNVMGVQFHPEKSHRFGMSLLQQFGQH